MIQLVAQKAFYLSATNNLILRFYNKMLIMYKILYLTILYYSTAP